VTGSVRVLGRDGLSARDRRALVSVAIQFFVNGAVWASVLPRLPEVRDRTGLTVAGLGLILTVGGALGLASSAFAGRIVERIGTRRVLTIGSSVMIAAVVVVANARSPAVLALGVASFAFVDVLIDISMNLQGSWISARRREPVMNRLHGLWSLGTVGGGAGAALAAGLGISLAVHVAVVAAVGVVLVVVVATGLLRVDEDHADPTGEESTGEESTGAAATGTPPVSATAAAPRAGRPVTPRRPMILLALAGAFALVIEQTASDWAAFRLSDDLAVSPGRAGLGFVAFTTGMTVARFGGDAAQARLGRDGLHRIAVGLAVAGLVVATVVQEPWTVTGGYLVAGLGVATFFPKIYDDAARLPGRRGAGLGALTAGSRLAGFAAPSLVGGLAATDLGVGAAVAIVTLPCAAGFAAVTARTRPGRIR
jgi:MFS family permease